MNNKKIILIYLIIKFINFPTNTMCKAESAKNFGNDACSNLINVSDGNISNNLQQSNHVAFIHDQRELALALYSSQICEINLCNNLKVTGNIEINRSVSLNLNNHAVVFEDCGSMIIGKTEFKTVEVKKHKSGHWDAKAIQKYQNEKGEWSTTYQNLWVPAEDYTEYEQKEILSDQNVTIRDGFIFGYRGKDGQKRISYKNGKNGGSAIVMLSGELSMYNITVQGGNGGNGIDGCWEIGGNGGNGGNGGDAINLKSGNSFTATLCNFKEGQGGKGGKKDQVGWTSVFCSNGLNGKDGKIINQTKEIAHVYTN